MGQASYFWTTNGTGDGTSGGYTAANFSQFMRDAMLSSSGEGVLFGVDNGLACTAGVGLNVTVATGAAIVAGRFYYNDLALSQAVDSSATSRMDSIILKTDTTAQTIRIAVKKNTDGVTTPPALVTSGNVEIRLANVLITGSNITSVTDARTFTKAPLAYGWFNTPLTLNSTLNVSGNITTTSDLTVSGGDIRLGSDVDMRRSAANTLTIEDVVVVEYSNNGASGMTISNPNTGSSADTRLVMQVASSASSDPFVQFRVADGGVVQTYWTVGSDNSDADNFKIANAINLGTNPRLTIDSASGLTTLSSLSTSSGTITNATLGTATITTLSGTGIVGADNIATGAVTNAKIGALAVDAAKLASNAVETVKINANAVTSAKIADGAVETVKIAAAAVTSAKIATGGVETDNIASLAVTDAKIAAGAVTNAKIGALAVDAAKIASNAVETAKINNLAVTEAKIANLAVTNAKIADNSVYGSKIANNAIGTLQIAQYQVDGDRIGDWAPFFGGRQGGDAGSWNVAGTTSYTNPITLSGSTDVNRVAMYAGTCSITLSGAASGTATVTFNDRYTSGNKYAANPIIIANGLNTQNYLVDVVSTTVNDAVIRIQHRDGTTASGTFSVMWMAIGPSAQI